MSGTVAAPELRPAPSLLQLAVVFTIISLQSVGGGTTAWIRREVVNRRRWLGEPQFLGGLALAQISPGGNAVNLSIYIGSTLRGPAGALAVLCGMVLIPVVLVLALGAAFAALHDVPGVDSAMAGVGAAAVGLTLANGMDLTRRAGRRPASLLVIAATTAAVGVFGLSLLLVLVLMIPTSLLLARRR
jgi:chromate transporter